MKKTSAITIVIPVAKDEKYQQVINAIKKSVYPSKRIEIIVIKGNQPSIQRNEAVKKSKFPIVYFLDNDAIPDKLNFERIINFFDTHKKAAVLGGPSLSPPAEKGFGYEAGIALGSFWGTVFSSARYSKKGKLRQSSELELILCNMAFRKDIFVKAGMFNEKLYPNEENELLHRIKSMGYEIWYDPELVVFRKHRDNIFKFIKQIFTYGRGRADQICVDIKQITLFPIISLMWDIYLLLIPVLSKLPFLIYLWGLFSVSFYQMIKNRRFMPGLFIIYFILHTIYGLGFIYGIIKNIFSKTTSTTHKIWYKTVLHRII